MIAYAQEPTKEKPSKWSWDCYSNNSDEAKISWVNDNNINSCKFNSLIIPNNYIESVESGNIFDKKSFFYHHYYIETEICDIKKCTRCNEKYLYNLMISNKSLCVPTTETTHMHNCETTFLDEAAIGVYQTDPIVTTMQPENYSITNYTVKINFKKEVIVYNKNEPFVMIGDKLFRGLSYEHILHPGKTQRTIFKRGDKVYIGTLGDGVVKGGRFNNCLGKMLFSKIDEALIAAFECNPEPPTLLNLAGTVSKSAKAILATKLLPFSEGYAIIKRGTSEAMIDSNGEQFIDFGIYDYADYDEFDNIGFKKRLCKVEKTYNFQYKKIYGFINLNKELVVPYKYIYTGFFTPELGFGREPLPNDDKPLHLINNKGQDLGIDLTKTIFPKVDNGVVALGIKSEGHGENRRYKFIDYNGSERISIAWLSAHNFSEGLAAVRAGTTYNVGKWGFINAQGKTVIPFIYNKEPGDFHSGRARVILKETKLKNGELDIEYGYIDMSGKLIDKLTQKTTGYFSGGITDWNWSDFNDYYVFCGKAEGGYSTNSIMDINGIKYDFSKISQKFSYHSREVIFTMANGSPEYFAIDPMVVGGLPRNWVGIPVIWRIQLTPISFKKGLLSPEGNLIIPPVFDELGTFDPVSKLAYAKYTDENGRVTEGYITINGIFQIIKL